MIIFHLLKQKIFGEDRLLLEDSDLASVSDELRVVSIHDEGSEGVTSAVADFAKSDEELARLLQVFVF